MRKFCVALGFAMMVLVPSASFAQSVQFRDKFDLPVEFYITPAEAPCLTETIHVVGTNEIRMLLVINPAGGYFYQEGANVRGMTATGLDTGAKYRYSGPLQYTENGSTDEWPVELTFHNINHFVGPGDLANIYFRTLIHITYDPETGERKTRIVRDELLCK